MREVTEEQNRARKILTNVFSVFVGIDVATTLAAQDYFAGGIRILLTVSLMYCVLAGFKWAKWLSVILLSAGGVVTLALFIPQLVQGSVFTLLFLGVGIGFLMLAVYLVLSKNLNSYFDYRREARNL